MRRNDNNRSITKAIKFKHLLIMKSAEKIEINGINGKLLIKHRRKIMYASV